MNSFDATEIAYKNGYEAGKKDAQKERDLALQAHAEMCAKAEQLELERDAAIKDLKAITERHNICDCCIHTTYPNGDDCDFLGCEWEWRGVQDCK